MQMKTLQARQVDLFRLAVLRPKKLARSLYNFSARKLVRSSVGSLDFWLQTEHSWNHKYHAICSFSQSFKIGSLINSIELSPFLATILYHNDFLGLTGSHKRVMQRAYCGSTPHLSVRAVFAQINSFHLKKPTFYSSISPFLLGEKNNQEGIQRCFSGLLVNKQ